MSPDPHEARRRTAIAIGLAVLAAGLFARTAGYPFIDLDDPSYVRDNVYIAGGLSARVVAWAFGSLYAANWHPLTWISHALDITLFGMSPGAHHAVSVLLHAANTVLLFRVLDRMTGRPWPSAFVAALFAAHPLHVESVAWIAERKDVLSTLFWFLALLAYARYVEQPSTRRYAAVAAYFALGLLAKPMLVTLPVTLLLLDAWPLRRFTAGRARALVIEKLPLFALSATSAALTFVAQHAGGAVRTMVDVPLGDRLANAPLAIVLYLVKMAWPSGLSAFYPLQVGQVSRVAGALAAALIVALTVALARWRVERPYLLAGWAWYLVTLLPVIGIVQVGDQALANRYTYVPLVGPFVALAWLGADLARERALFARIVPAIAVLAVLACSALTWVEVGWWQSTLTLFTRARDVSGGRNGLAEFVIGSELQKQGRLDAAIEQYRRALVLLPGDAQVLTNLGQALVDAGRLDEGIDACRRATVAGPRFGLAWVNLGAALARRGDLPGSIDAFHRAIEINALDPRAWYNLGLALELGGRRRDALDAFRRASRIDPRDPDARARITALEATR